MVILQNSTLCFSLSVDCFAERLQFADERFAHSLVCALRSVCFRRAHTVALSPIFDTLCDAASGAACQPTIFTRRRGCFIFPRRRSALSVSLHVHERTSIVCFPVAGSTG